jgi:type I restriction enzyme M protein
VAQKIIGGGFLFLYEELISRDKASLDIFWLRDESVEDSDNLPDPGVLAQEIVDDLEASPEQFRLIAEDLGEEKETNEDRAATET